MLVSVIIPVYKVEQYIERCIESILNQTYRQLEVILVDDCSPDNSMGIAKSYIENSTKARDLQFRYLQHEYNRGQAAARNTGLAAAKGEYIFFMDSDDEISSQCIEILVSECEEGKFDVVSADMEAIGGENPLYSFKHKSCRYDNTHDIVKAYVNEEIYMIIWNKLLRREIIANHVQFKEGLSYEDELWSFLLVNNVSSWKNIEQKTYIYYIRPNSLSTQKVTSKKYYALYALIDNMVQLWKTKVIPSYKENYSYIQTKRVSWMVAILRSSLSIKEKLSLFGDFYKLPIGENYTFVRNVISAQITNTLYPYRSSISLQIRKLINKK